MTAVSEVDATHAHRNGRQSWFFDWAQKAFGGEVINRRVRAFRFLEEAMELAQTQGLTLEDVYRQANYTFAREVGEVKQEIGGVTLSLYALAENLGISVDGCEADELLRVRGATPADYAKMAAKNALKVQAGLC